MATLTQRTHVVEERTDRLETTLAAFMARTDESLGRLERNIERREQEGAREREFDALYVGTRAVLLNETGTDQRGLRPQPLPRKPPGAVFSCAGGLPVYRPPNSRSAASRARSARSSAAGPGPVWRSLKYSQKFDRSFCATGSAIDSRHSMCTDLS